MDYSELANWHDQAQLVMVGGGGEGRRKKEEGGGRDVGEVGWGEGGGLHSCTVVD